MPETRQRSNAVNAGRWATRLAGALLIVVGALNVAFGLLSLFSDQVLLSTGVAGGLAMAGLVTAAAGVLVWRGSQLATYIALTIFGLLLFVQLGDFIQEGGGTGDGLAQHPATRFGVLTLLVITLALAAWQLRRRTPARSRPRP